MVTCDLMETDWIIRIACGWDFRYLGHMFSRVTHITVSFLLLAAYLLSFTVTSASHAHVVHDQDQLRHVHVQAAAPDKEAGHSANCIYCLRIQTSAVVSPKLATIGMVLPCVAPVPQSTPTLSSIVRFDHCPGRAPPLPQS